MKVLKYALAALGTVGLVIAAVAAYFLATFEPRDYAPRITALVKEQTGRDLRIAGEFGLSFWPDIGVRLGAVSLSERDSEERFVDADTVRFTVRIAPLFSRTLVAEDLLVQGAHVRIARYPDGRLNIDDLFKGEGPAPVFDIGRLKVERSTLSYHDVATAKRYELNAIELETGRLANAVVTPLKVSFAARDDAKSFEITTALDGRVVLDLAQRLYSIEQATLAAKGRVAEFDGLAVQLKGNVAARAGTGTLEATGVALVFNGAARGEQVQASLQSPKLRWSAGSWIAESPSASLDAASAAGNARIAVSSPEVIVQSGSAVVESATVELDVSRGKTRANISMTSRAELQTAAGVLILSKLDSKGRVHGSGLPATGLSGVLAGHARLEIPGQVARASLAGVVSGSRMKADLVAIGFAAPVYRFAIDIDQLDLDRFAAGGGARDGKDAGFDLSTLSKLPATGTLHIGTLTTGGLKARNVKVAVKP